MKIFRTTYFPLAVSLVLATALHAQDSTKTANTLDSLKAASSANGAPAAEAPAAEAPQKKKSVEEKVIVVGYGAMKKKDITGSVSLVDGKDLKKSNATNVGQALQGKASGVTITSNSGQPGKPVSVRVRGMGSINNSDPLYVVDGMPTTDIQYLNPLDIETITVLKDASSTSIYGARGANGVVLITTKKGAPGQSKVTYNGTYGVSSPWKKPSFVSSADWVKLHNEAIVNSGDSNAADLHPPATAPATDWFGAVTRANAINYGNNFSLAQGDKQLNYFLSGGQTKDEGIVRGSDSKKATVRANVTSKVNSWLTVGNNIGYTNQQDNVANEADEWSSTLITSISFNPTIPIYKSPGVLSADTGGQGILNPVGVVQHNHDFEETNRIKGNVFATVKPVDFLELKTSYGLDVSDKDISIFRPKYFIGPADQLAASVVHRENIKENDWVWENTASIDKAFGDHFLKFLVGATAEEDNTENMVAINSVTPTNDPSQRYLSSTLSVGPTVSGAANSSALLSYLARANYDYNAKYFFTASVRTDGSSKFGPENRWGTFPSVGLGWDVSKESFMEPVTFINYLKLRAGYGVIGNQNIDNYQYLTTTTNNQDYVIGKPQGGAEGGISKGATFKSAGNPAVQWESQTSSNLGLDFTVLDNSIEFTSDFYDKKTSKMLVRAAVPGQVGFAIAPIVNAGDVDNKGFDLGLSYKKDIGSFTSKVSGNLSVYRNKVTSLGQGGQPILSVPFRDMGFVSKTEVGHPIASFYGYETDGLFQTQAEIDKYYKVIPDPVVAGQMDTIRPQANAAPGDIRYKMDSQGNLIQDYIGSPHPDFTYGFGLDLGHKGAYGAVDFYMFFQGVQGNKIFNGNRYYTDQTTGFFNLDKRMLGRWTGPGSTNDATTPRMNASDATNTRISDRYVEDGSYLRLKTITLGYTLPASITTELKIPQIRIYAGATNLLTFTKYSGFDPEVGNGRFSGSQEDDPANEGALDFGVDRANYPQSRSVYTGIEVSL